MDRNALISELKTKISQTLNLQDLGEDALDENVKLFSDDGLGLDSVDALELVVMLETSYGISVGDKDEAKNTFSSIGTLADYIIANKK